MYNSTIKEIKFPFFVPTGTEITRVKIRRYFTCEGGSDSGDLFGDFFTLNVSLKKKKS